MLSLGVSTGVEAPLYAGGAQTSAPVLLSAPTFTGAGAVGEVLTVTPGTYDSDPPATITVEWRRDGQLLASQSGPTYTVGAVDAGAVLFACVRAENPGGVTLTCTAPIPVYPNVSINPWHVVSDLDITVMRAPGAPPAPNVSVQGMQLTLS